MTMAALLPDTAGRPKEWDGVPQLATCSYDRFDRAMGTAVRITRMAPRGVTLPNRWTDRQHWPVARALIPAAEIFHVGLAEAEFAALYRNDLARRWPQVIKDLRDLVPERPGALVLLCYEAMPAAETGCHRRVFAAWWKTRTGQDVPELG